MPPEPARVGKAVQQHRRPALTGDLVLDTDPVDIHPCHLASFCNAETSARSCSRVGPNGCSSRQPDPSWRDLSRSPGRRRPPRASSARFLAPLRRPPPPRSAPWSETRPRPREATDTTDTYLARAPVLTAASRECPSP